MANKKRDGRCQQGRQCAMRAADIHGNPVTEVRFFTWKWVTAEAGVATALGLTRRSSQVYDAPRRVSNSRHDGGLAQAHTHALRYYVGGSERGRTAGKTVVPVKLVDASGLPSPSLGIRVDRLRKLLPWLSPGARSRRQRNRTKSANMNGGSREQKKVIMRQRCGILDGRTSAKRRCAGDENDDGLAKMPSRTL